MIMVMIRRRRIIIQKIKIVMIRNSSLKKGIPCAFRTLE